MNLHLVRRPRRNAALAVLLALSLLLMQWLGYAHAIAHAEGQPEFEKVAATQDDSFGHAKSASACAALDAVALGAGLQAAPVVLCPPATADTVLTQPPCAGWRRLFSAHFCSRAPPLNA